VTRTVPASAEQIFELLADPAKHAVIDGSGTVQAARGQAQRLALGSTFGMDMSMGVPYRITNKVVEFEEGRLIAWRHAMRHRWRWELTPLGEYATEVTETFDYSTTPLGFGLELAKFPERNKKAIEKTLDRLVEHFSS
jgi:uncharacterized protein YndB with AHSA1/START domain